MYSLVVVNINYSYFGPKPPYIAETPWDRRICRFMPFRRPTEVITLSSTSRAIDCTTMKAWDRLGAAATRGRRR